MNDIPSGFVTFLFTDIESSTMLAQEFPETLPASLGKHHSIMHEAIESHHGFVFESTSDTFCCAFANGVDAVKAAVMAQKNLSTEKWVDAVIKIRIGIHSGNAEWNGSNYMGYITLARSQRVMSSAYGEQIIISNNTYELLKENFSDINQLSFSPSRNQPREKPGGEVSNKNIRTNISFRDMGERRLKDLIHPVKLYQVVSAGLREDFPPLKTLDSRPNNLPVQLTNFIGREEEMMHVKKLLNQTRLLTLIGPGGTGKTRVALQIAADILDNFANGVWFVELAGLSDSSLLSESIMKSMGIKEQPMQTFDETLCEYLKDKEALVVLDNCEHIIDSCAKISEMLLQSSPKLKIIATSRESLRINGEQTHQVTPLAFPDPNDNNTPEKLSQYESVRLFIERALSVDQRFRVNNENAPALAQICFQLDGIPLAIELAAARINILSPEKICEKLSDRFKLLTGGKRTSLPRQQTLRALIDWSYDLLKEKEKLLFQRLSVFSGGWTMEAAEEICADEIIESYEMIDILTGLFDKSLVISKEISGYNRFYMLESIRQYAKEKFSDDKEIIRKHFEYFARLVDYTKFRSGEMKQIEWINQIEAELNNIRAAIQWGTDNDPEQVYDFINDITEYWEIKGYFSEGMLTCLKVLKAEKKVSQLHKAKVFHSAGLMAYGLGKMVEANKFVKDSLTIFRELNYLPGIVNCLSLTGSIFNMSFTTTEEALKCYNEALIIVRELNMKEKTANLLYNMSFSHQAEGKIDLALENKKEALALYKEINDTCRISLTLASLGVFEFRLNNFHSAKTYSEESLSIAYTIGDKYLISINLINLGSTYSGLKEHENALRLMEEAITISKECGYKANLIPSLYYLGNIMNKLGQFEKASTSFKESILTGLNLGIDFFLLENLYSLSITYFNLSDFERSVKHLSFVKSILEGSGNSYSNFVNKKDESFENELRETIEDILFEKYWNEGINLSMDDAVKYALDNITC